VLAGLSSTSSDSDSDSDSFSEEETSSTSSESDSTSSEDTEKNEVVFGPMSLKGYFGIIQEEECQVRDFNRNVELDNMNLDPKTKKTFFNALYLSFTG